LLIFASLVVAQGLWGNGESQICLEGETLSSAWGLCELGALRVFSTLMNPLRGHKSARSHQQSEVFFSAEEL
jgi:hypothetical protein